MKATAPVAFEKNDEKKTFKIESLNYELGQKVATRRAYGNALVTLGKSDVHKQIVVLDGDTNNSAFTNSFKEANPKNYIECFIAE